MRIDDRAKIDLIALIILIILLFIFRGINDSGWNNGYCSCGGKWLYQQAIGHRYETVYLYECDTCGKIQEFYKKYAEIK